MCNAKVMVKLLKIKKMSVYVLSGVQISSPDIYLECKSAFTHQHTHTLCDLLMSSAMTVDIAVTRSHY